MPSGTSPPIGPDVRHLSGWVRGACEVWDKPPHSKQLAPKTDVPLFDLHLWAGCNVHLPAAKVVIQILYLSLWVGSDPNLQQGLQHCSYLLHMLNPGVAVYDRVIQVGGNISNMGGTQPEGIGRWLEHQTSKQKRV